MKGQHFRDQHFQRGQRARLGAKTSRRNSGQEGREPLARAMPAASRWSLSRSPANVSRACRTRWELGYCTMATSDCGG